MLQDHKGTEVSFRNLWIVPDIDYDKSLPKFRQSFASTPTVLANVKPEPKPAREPITVLPEGMVRDMDQNNDRIITPKEFIDYRARQFDSRDKNRDEFLDPKEFPSRGAFRGGDKNKDGKLSREEHLNIFRSQFPNVDTNRDGKITAEDKRIRK